MGWAAVMQAFTMLFAKMAKMAAFYIALAIAAFVGLWLLSTDVGCWVFEQVLKLLGNILNSLDFDLSALNLGTYAAGLAPEMINMLGLIGVTQGVTMIVSAIAIRITLQLIPFTRLGS